MQFYNISARVHESAGSCGRLMAIAAIPPHCRRARYPTTTTVIRIRGDPPQLSIVVASRESSISILLGETLTNRLCWLR